MTVYCHCHQYDITVLRTTVCFVAAIRTISDAVAELCTTDTGLAPVAFKLARTTVSLSSHI